MTGPTATLIGTGIGGGVAFLTLSWLIYSSLRKGIAINTEKILEVSGKLDVLNGGDGGEESSPGYDWYTKQAETLGKVMSTCEFLQQSMTSLEKNSSHGFDVVHERLNKLEEHLKSVDGAVGKLSGSIRVAETKIKEVRSVADEARRKAEALGASVSRLERNNRDKK